MARAIGLPLGQQFEITTHVPYQELTPSSLDEAIQSAYKARADFQSQMNQVRSAELARKAASAERYPSLGAETDYGLSGVNPGSSHGTVDAAATLRIPIFQGGRVHGDVLRADASLTEERQRLEDLRAKIDQEVRDALSRSGSRCARSVCREKRGNARHSDPGTISRSIHFGSYGQH